MMPASNTLSSRATNQLTSQQQQQSSSSSSTTLN
ncbi:unnamed protein product, partial [Rotaria magnacalcarata]